MTDTAISPLRRRMIEDMTIRGFAAQTQSGYLRSVRDFAAFLGGPPDGADAEDLRRYQLHLRSGAVSASSVNAAVTDSSTRSFFMGHFPFVVGSFLVDRDRVAHFTGRSSD